MSAEAVTPEVTAHDHPVSRFPGGSRLHDLLLSQQRGPFYQFRHGHGLAAIAELVVISLTSALRSARFAPSHQWFQERTGLGW